MAPLVACVRQRMLRSEPYVPRTTLGLSGIGGAPNRMGNYVGPPSIVNSPLTTATIIEPKWPWEFVQIGNCGSPIELAEGWLVVTHGVGAMRNYALGACLLDREDPSKLLGRTTYPLVRPDATERKGYVPNVVYSCGALLHGRTLVLPYAVADSFTTFATMPVDRLLAAMA